MLGIVGLRAFHSTELEGRREGFQMTVNTAQGTSYDIGIPAEVYEALISVFETEREAVRHPEYAPRQVQLEDTDHPTGSPDEVAAVQSVLQQMEPQDSPDDVFSITEAGQSELARIGFVSDEQLDRNEQTDPVEEVLFLAETGEEEEQETGDALMEYSEEPEEDIGQL